jgi:Protein of unknown function (DUF2905)
MEEENVVQKLSGGKVFLILWLLSAAVMYFLSTKQGNPLVLPGDIYTRKGVNKIYIPIGSSLYLAIILFIILKIFFKI